MSEKWKSGGFGDIFSEFGEAEQWICEAKSPAVAKRIVTAVNNHEALVEALDVALDAIGEAMDAGITMGSISPETFQEYRVLLADIDKESS